MISNDKLVEKARNLAISAHKEQKRKFGADKGRPYTVHLERVASVFTKPEFKAAAWLHDIIEDTDITIRDLVKLGFPKTVVCAIAFLTHKETTSYAAYIMTIASDIDTDDKDLYAGQRIAKAVKMADLRDNLSSLPRDHKQRKEKYELALMILLQGLNNELN